MNRNAFVASIVVDGEMGNMLNRQSKMLIFFLVAATSLTCASAADHWPQFRGPTGDGQTVADGLPITWSEQENIVWKTPIHDRGWSSPVTWGKQVWMTTATADGHEMFAVCVALDSGEILHDINVFTNGEIVQKMGPTNSYASPTPVIEEGRVYVHFGVYGTACLDTTSGKVLWQRRDIHCDHSVGPGSSPILWGDLIIFHMDGIDVQYVIALDKQTGRTVWKTARSVDFTGIPGDFRKAYSTPMVIETGGTRQLISTGAQCSYSYDPTTGEELWRVRHKGFSNVWRPLFGHGLVYLNSAYPKASLIAVRPDGRGDVTDSHVAWEFGKGVPVKPSPVMVGDWIFTVSDKGIATCIEATTGELAWQQRIGGEYSASPIYWGGRIYFFSHDGKATVIEAVGEYKELAVNLLDTGFRASPAVVDRALILRTETHLYRVEKSGNPRPAVSAEIAIPARDHAAKRISDSEKQWNKKAFDKLYPDAGVGIEERVATLQPEMAENRAKLREKLGVDEILFIKRIPYTASHYYTEFLDSRWTPGGGIFALSLTDGSERQVAQELEGGIFGRFDLSFDATKIVFDWKRSADEGYRIYEVGIDGSGLRQILHAPENEAQLIEKFRLGYHNGTDDMHPCYLPDGGIAFVSTRCQASTLCHGGDAFTTPVLYRVDADGGNLKQLSFGPLSEFTPTVLPDGRIMYARWEYVDKGAVVAKALWAVRPDGTASSEIYGNDVQFPSTMIQGRAIPGAADKYVVLGCPHYPQNALGTIIRIDMSKSIRTDEPMTYMTPQVKVLAEAGWHFQDATPGRMVEDRSGKGPLFRDPYPIDEDHFLVAHKPRGFGSSYAPTGYGLYLLTSDGKSAPFYRDPTTSCWQPVPLAPREMPPVLRSATDQRLAAQNLAKCVVTNIYHGMENVEPGEIKYLRVLEQIPRPWSARRHDRGREDSYDQQYAVVSKDGALAVKVQHGVVPVEEDGSAHFVVPANANIFFQALDENYLAVQTERTFVNYMPGETRSCIGCHETPDAVPTSPSTLPLALARRPSLPGPQIGETAGRRPLHYPTDVQPVLDRHCTECHNEEQKDGGLDLTGRMTTFFSASYENLLPERRGARKDRVNPGLVPMIGENHPKDGNVHYLPVRSLGSHNSLLIAMLAPDKVRLVGDEARTERLAKLIESHKDVKLKPEELLKISNWVDTNAQYFGSYYGRRNLKDKAHPNFRPVPTWDSAIGIPPLPEDER